LTRNFPWSPSWVGTVAVCSILGALYFLEPILKIKDFNFPLDSGNQSPTSLPIETPLTVYSLPRLEGIEPAASLKLSELGKNRPLLVNFWATWCEPCIDEIPSLNALFQQARSNDSLPLLVTISVDEKKEAITNLRKSLDSPFNFPILHDPDGAFSKQIGVIKFPETFLIDSTGKIRHKWIGPQDWLSMEIIQQLNILRIAN